MEKILYKPADEMYRDDMVKYSIIINRRRAFVDVKDGLKLVDRRIIYDMYTLNATDKLTKSARISGDVSGKYHPHGDVGIYQSMVVLGSWFSMKYPLITPHGNFGTVMGDKASASRYTESKLSEFCFDCIISDLKVSKQSVNWIDAYTRRDMEPEYLPVKVPVLLINGTMGIGVGIAAKVPPHNLIDVLEATRKLIKDPSYTPALIPDHCQPIKIMDTDWKAIGKAGYGKYFVRGEVQYAEEKGCIVIHILSLPDSVTTTSIVDKLCEAVEHKQLPMIKDIIDASASVRDNPTKKPVDIQIHLKKGSDPEYVIQYLYAKTFVQTSITVNLEAVDGLNPERMSYKRYLQSFIDNRMTTKFRIYCNRLKEANTRYHKLDAYIKVIKSGEIDNIINLVKKQKITDNNIITEYLVEKCKITDLQAGFILSINILQLSNGYLKKYEAEYTELGKAIANYKNIITEDDGSSILHEIDLELLDIEKKFGTPRICKVIKPADDANIPQGIFKIIITEKNMVRKLLDTDKINIVRGDNPKFVMRVDNTENIILFDAVGKCFKLPVHKIPMTDKSYGGTDARVLNKNIMSDIIVAYYEPQLKAAVEHGRKHFILVTTKMNTIKKMDIEDFLSINVSGLQYTKLKDGDVVVGVAVAPDGLDAIVYSDQKALRTKLSNIPIFKRNAIGSKAMGTDTDIRGLTIVYPDVQFLVTITDSGKANKFSIDLLGSHGRGSNGNNVIKLADNDGIFSLFGASDNDIIRVVSSGAISEIPVSAIGSKSSVSSGTKISGVKGNIVHCDIVRNH